MINTNKPINPPSEELCDYIIDKLGVEHSIKGKVFLNQYICLLRFVKNKIMKKQLFPFLAIGEVKFLDVIY